MDVESRLIFAHLSPLRKKKIKEALRAVAHDPRVGKPLQEQLAGLLSYRVGSLRIIYQIHPTRKLVQVVAIGPRRSIYEELEKELSIKKPLSS